MDRWVSASQLKTALVCPASLVLPRRTKAYSDNAEKAADFGTAAHHFVETGEILDKPGLAEWASKVDRNRLYPAKGHHEVVVWYHPVTKDVGMKIPTEPPGQRKHRDYEGIDPDAIVGTIDFMCKLDDNRWWIDDLKTGAKMFLPQPDSEQMYFAASVLNRMFDIDVLSTITWAPRYPKEQKPTRQKCQFSKKHCDVFIEKLDRMYQLYKDGNKREVKNSGCRYCKCAEACSVGRKVIEDVAARRAAKEANH